MKFGLHSLLARACSILPAAVLACLVATGAANAAPVVTLPISFAVDHTGAATLNVPIDVPSGTNGMTPHMSLSYSSSKANGPVGVGWSLDGFPAITRCPATIATNNMAAPVTLANGANGDRFCFAGDPLVPVQQQNAVGQAPSGGTQFTSGGQLIGLPASNYGADQAVYTTEIEELSRIVSYSANGTGPSSFLTFTKSGLIYEFGATSNAQVVGSGTTILTWLLDKVTDPFGNSIQVTYQSNAGKAYPSQVSYTSGNGLAPQYLVQFNYIGGRTDDPLQFTAGVSSQTALQLNTIQVQQLVSGSYSTISTYALTYSTGITGRLRLATITRTGASGGTVLPLSFSYCDQCNAPADLLTNFYNGLDGSPASGTNPASGGTQITYLLTTHSSVYPTTFNAAVQYPSQNLVKPRYVVQTVQAPDETGSNYTPGTYNVTYTYFNGLQNLVGRGFLGFGSVCAFDSQTTLQKCTSYNQQFPNIGNVMETKVSYCPNKDVACTGAVVQQDTQTTFGTFTPYNGRPAANTSIVTNVVTTGADLNGNPLPTTTKYCGTPTNSTCVTDGYGNELVETTTIQSDVEGGWVNSTYTTVANYTFANDLASWAVEPSGTTPLNWLIGKLTQSSVTGSYTNSKVSPPVTTTTSARVTQYSYTPVAPLAPVQTGFLSQETVQPTSGGGCQTGFTAVTNYTPDVYGHVAQEVVSAPCDSTPAGALASRTTQWSYSDASDPNHVFPHQITNALNQVEKREYDMRWGLESSVTDINNQTTTYTYDDLGRRTQEVPNDSSKITTSYIGCTGSPATTVTATNMACPSGGQYAIQTTHIGADNATTISPKTTAYYDILDRQVADDTLAFDGVNLSRVAKTYNSQLQVASTTRPYFAGPNTIQTPAITTYQYDQLNRVIRTNYPDSSWDTISFYETVQNITRGITANSSGEETYKYYDGAGKLVVSQQNSATLGGTAWIYTNYLYDGFGDLTQVTDNAGNITTYDYDVLGRKDGYTDPDAGGFLQNYNAFGQAYGGGNGFDSFDSIRYDQLGRMVWRCWTNPANATAAQDEYTCANATVGNVNEILETWTYDPAQGIGELGQEYSTQGTSTTIADTYNALGQPNTSSYTIGNGTGALNYSYSYSYDSVHRPSYYVSPNGSTTPLTTYNSTGYIASLSHKGGNTVWTAVTRDAEMHLTEASYGNGTGNGNGTGAGNGMASAYSYDPNRGYETQFVTTYTPPAGGTPVTVQNLAYSWDQHGNMVGRADTVNSLSEAYCYDGLNRLGDVQSGSTTCSFGGNTTMQLNYTTTSGSSPVTTADIGNIIYKSDIGNYTYPATGQPQPHGVQTITNPSTGATLYTITYDSVGKVLKDGLSGTTLTYTPFQMPLKVKAASGASYTVQYDADHHRIMRTAGSADLAIYLPDSDLSVNTSTGKTIWNTYFMAGGQRVGSDTGTQTSSGITLTTEYFENDYQNSIGLVTADNFSGANPKVNQGFDAFGHPRSVTGTDTTPWPTTTPPRGYINQVMLPAEEIVDLNARYYDPALGRFLAPDPVISDMDDSQAWNAYSYSDNNPMSKSDPTGLDSCTPGSDCIRVPAPPIPEGGYNGAHAAAVVARAAPPGGRDAGLSAIQQLINRAAQGGPHSVAARSLAENFNGTTGSGADANGNAFTFAGVAGSLAVSVNGLVAQVENDASDENTLLGTALGIVDSLPAEGALEQGVVKGGEAVVSASDRAIQLANALGKTKDFVTIAVTDTAEGLRIISSSENALRTAVLKILTHGEVAVTGAGHAEVTGVNAAKSIQLKPIGTAASRPICPDCGEFLQNNGVAPLSPLK